VKRLVGILSVAVLFIAGTALAAPMYVTPENPDPQIGISINAVGTLPEDSDLPFRWYWSYEDRFNINFESVLGSADITDGSDWTAVSSAINTWDIVPNSSITSSLGGYDGDWGGLNGDNELAWIENGWTTFAGFGFRSNAIAVTVTWYYPDTLIQVESDIFFNGDNFTWYTDTDDSGSEREFVEHIALHELGHAFSLKDLYSSDDADRTMYGYSGNRNEDITLHSGDVAALEYAYPIPEPATICLLGLGALGLLKKRRA
jgi:hypothetical protein